MKPVERTRISYNEKDILQRYYERSIVGIGSSYGESIEIYGEYIESTAA